MSKPAKSKTAEPIQRIQYDTPKNIYCNKVLIGPWVNDRYYSTSIEENFKNTTTYEDSYYPKPPSSVDPSFIWDFKIKSEDSNFISQIGKAEFPNYFENFSSIYDLAYNRFPRCYGTYIPRKLRFRMDSYEPKEEYLPSFGNLTNYGLIEHLRAKWNCEVGDPRITYSTHYRDTFVNPPVEAYERCRKAIPINNSSSMLKTNQENIALRLRNKPISVVPFAENLLLIPREKRPNPITWE